MKEFEYEYVLTFYNPIGEERGTIVAFEARQAADIVSAKAADYGVVAGWTVYRDGRLVGMGQEGEDDAEH